MPKNAHLLETPLARSFFETASDQNAPVYHDNFGNLYFFDRHVEGCKGTDTFEVPVPMIKLLVDGADEEDMGDPVEGVERTVLLNHYRLRRSPNIYSEMRNSARSYFMRGKKVRVSHGVKFERFFILDKTGKALLEVIQDIGTPA